MKKRERQKKRITKIRLYVIHAWLHAWWDLFVGLVTYSYIGDAAFLFSTSTSHCLALDHVLHGKPRCVEWLLTSGWLMSDDWQPWPSYKSWLICCSASDATHPWTANHRSPYNNNTVHSTKQSSVVCLHHRADASDDCIMGLGENFCKADSYDEKYWALNKGQNKMKRTMYVYMQGVCEGEGQGDWLPYRDENPGHEVF